MRISPVSEIQRQHQISDAKLQRGPSLSAVDTYVVMHTVLITGGCGFIGSNLIRLALAEKPEWQVVNLDALTYAGNLENLKDCENHSQYTFVKADITDAAAINAVYEQHKPDLVIHLAAESHVDRSILDSGPFIQTNVTGTQVLLDAARKHQVKRHVQVSTDEVYGSLGQTGYFTEQTPLAPNSPYSASKASSDMLVRAYHHTFGLDVVTTRCSNNYGPNQFPEKIIPLFISNALEDRKLPVYGAGTNVRDWIFVTDHCRGIIAATERGTAGEIYNFGGDSELTNLDLTQRLLSLLGKPESLIEFVTDRPGHDLRYAIDFSKATAELNWKPEVTFDQGLQQTIDWYLNNTQWVDRVRSGDYQNYYNTQYAQRLAGTEPAGN